MKNCYPWRKSCFGDFTSGNKMCEKCKNKRDCIESMGRLSVTGNPKFKLPY